MPLLPIWLTGSPDRTYIDKDVWEVCLADTRTDLEVEDTTIEVEVQLTQ